MRTITLPRIFMKRASVEFHNFFDNLNQKNSKTEDDVTILDEKKNTEGNEHFRMHSWIFFAIHSNNPELLDNILRASNIDVNELNEDGVSALHFASIVGCIRCLKILVQFGGCLKNEDIRGRAPLDYAASMDRKEIVDYILSNK